MDNHNLLIFFNYDDKTLNNIKQRFYNHSIFKNIYSVTWNLYKENSYDQVSISSLVSFDQHIIKYIQGYKIKNTSSYKLIFEKYFSTYCAMLLRRTRKEVRFNILEFRHLFNIHFKFIEKFLLTKKITHIFMGPSSSAGFDLLFQIIPNYLKIKVIYAENFHSQKFFYTTKFNDWGYFNYADEIFEKIEAKIYKKDPTELFYIKQYTSSYNRSNKLYYKILFILYMSKLMIETFILSIFSKKILVKSFFETSGKLWTKASGTLFNLNKNIHFSSKFKNLNFDYVYFPLSYQPEATTLAFGDEWDDQLLAIEKISKIIPEKWKILVKEHPYQWEGAYRGELYFQRLKSINQVCLIDNKSFTTEELIINSNFTSTVSGNSGWEAIRYLKPVLLFGRPWYLTCPGVTHINNVSNLNSIIEKTWSLKNIEEHISNMTKKMGDGLITLDYLNSKDMFNDYKTSKYNYDENIEKIVNSFLKIIKNDKTVWF